MDAAEAARRSEENRALPLHHLGYTVSKVFSAIEAAVMQGQRTCSLFYVLDKWETDDEDHWAMVTAHFTQLGYRISPLEISW